MPALEAQAGGSAHRPSSERPAAYLKRGSATEPSAGGGQPSVRSAAGPAAYLHAEVEHVERSLVRVNIAKLLASDWAPERAEYDSDEEFAKGVLRKIGWRDLIEPCDEDDIGIAVEGEYDDAEIRVLGTVPA